MTRFITFVFIVIAATACTTATKTDTTNQDKADMTSVDSIAADTLVVETEISLPELNIDNFELDYFKEIAKTADNKNFSTSPVSVTFSLSMIANFCDTPLQKQIIKVMKAESLTRLNNRVLRDINRLTNSSEDTKMLIGNSLWLTNTQPINLGSRRDSLQKYFKATVAEVDFSNPQTIDRIISWGHQASDGNITPNIPHFSQDCGSIAISLLYYIGSWISPFDKNATKKQIFHKADGDTLVDMMHKEFSTRYYSTKDFKSVTMALKGDNSLLLILPKKGLTPNDILTNFNSSSLKRTIDNGQQTYIQLSLPRFEINTQQSIGQPLKNIGIELLPTQFKCLGLRNLGISIDQLTKIKLDEEGVQAKADTQTITVILSCDDDKYDDNPEPIVIKFDRPFIYLLRNNKTKSIIMSGIYAGPEE
ncbi:MAG: hypothetical protein K2J10_09620 [Muribaculaceae bacterium]|nr:hypothetical protein [Muribaculaceae bacterium]